MSADVETKARGVLAALDEMTAAPLAAWHAATADVEAERIDFDQFDEARDEAAYVVLEAVELALRVARAAGILPADVPAPITPAPAN